MADNNENCVAAGTGHTSARTTDVYQRTTKHSSEDPSRSFGAQDYVIRAAALASNDDLMRDVLLSLLNETPEQALAALSCSCWEEDLSANPAEQREWLRQSIASAITTPTPVGTL